MAYLAPYIDATGLHIPSYADILASLISSAHSVFGNDIYLGTDSQDYQWISVVAAKINDTLQAIQLAYDSRSPSTAIGTALDALIKINGIARSKATNSTCVVLLTGTANSVISNGVIGDKNGNKWSIPASVTIGTGGTISVTATAQQSGAIYANVGDINSIITPTLGWTSVTNNVSATPGLDVESDSKLRSRQAISTSLPSLTVLDGTKGAIAATTNVTRFVVYENDTGAADAYGLPARSVTAVVEGGLDADVAQAIYNKKGPGCLANGTTLVNITDKYGQVIPIGFYRPTYVDIDVVVNVKKLSNYTTATTTAIQKAIADFLTGMSMGANVIPVNNFYGPALSVQNLAKPTFTVTSITAAKHLGTQGTADITTLFNEAVRGNTAYVTVNAV